MMFSDGSIHDLISIAFLIVIVGLWVLPAWRAFLRPSDYSSLEKLLYAPVYVLGRLLWRVEVIGGTKDLSQSMKAGAVIVANHRCSLDPFFLQLAAGRRVHWMVAGEYFRNPIFGPILRIFQAIPTNRSGADNAAMKQAIRLASEGCFVGMFPEGRINRTRKPLQSVRPGAAMVAEKARVPLLPCWIEGAPIGWAVWSGIFMAAHVRVFIGAPLTDRELPAMENAHPHERLIREAMTRSLQLGGHSDWPVELGGRRQRLERLRTTGDGGASP